jgi:putative membrane protein
VLSAANYVETGGSIDLFIIRSSDLALERSSSRRVRDFAAAEIEAHKGTAAQLSLAGRRLNLLPAAGLRSQEQQLFDTLAQAPNFDAVYVRQQRLVHQQALALDEDYSASGQSATLRPVALAAAQIIQRHLSTLAYHSAPQDCRTGSEYPNAALTIIPKPIFALRCEVCMHGKQFFQQTLDRRRCARGRSHPHARAGDCPIGPGGHCGVTRLVEEQCNFGGAQCAPGGTCAATCIAVRGAARPSIGIFDAPRSSGSAARCGALRRGDP